MTSLNQPPQAKPAIRSILIALMLAIFLGALDQTIVAVSMPAISAQFKDVSQLAWVISLNWAEMAGMETATMV